MSLYVYVDYYDYTESNCKSWFTMQKLVINYWGEKLISLFFNNPHRKCRYNLSGKKCPLKFHYQIGYNFMARRPMVVYANLTSYYLEGLGFKGCVEEAIVAKESLEERSQNGSLTGSYASVSNHTLDWPLNSLLKLTYLLYFLNWTLLIYFNLRLFF